jgi:hypothetical protein
MLIHVLNQNHKFDFIKTSRLDELIESRQILAFKRRKGWVRIGMDPVRVIAYDTSYQGRERRRLQEKLVEEESVLHIG